jgi:hypothetical protein
MYIHTYIHIEIYPHASFLEGMEPEGFAAIKLVVTPDTSHTCTYMTIKLIETPSLRLLTRHTHSERWTDVSMDSGLCIHTSR